MEYNASSIVVKSETAIEQPYLIAKRLSEDYPFVPPAFIQRGITACHLAGVPVSHFEERYLIGDRSIPPEQELIYIYREILKEERA